MQKNIFIILLVILVFGTSSVHSQQLYEIGTSNLFCYIDSTNTASVYLEDDNGSLLQDDFEDSESWATKNLKKHQRRVKRFKSEAKKAQSSRQKKKLKKKVKSAKKSFKNFRAILSALIACRNLDIASLGVAVTHADAPAPTPSASPTASPSPPGGGGVSSPELPVSQFPLLVGGEIYANDGQFLGVISTNQFNTDSLCNEFGNYGNKFSATSIFNEFGQYGGQFAQNSPYNKFTTTPPVIFLDSKAVAYLTLNAFIGDTWVNTSLLVAWLGCVS